MKIQSIYNAIKTYLINGSAFFQAEGVTPLKDSDFYFGVVDLLKKRGAVVCAIVPDTQNEVDSSEQDDLSGYQEDTQFTVAFICRENKQSVLDENVCAYAEAFRKAVLTDCSLDGAITGCGIGERKYYFDVGTVEQQMSAVEITFTTRTTTNIS